MGKSLTKKEFIQKLANEDYVSVHPVGMNKPTLEGNLKVIKEAGFEGVEMIVPGDNAGRNRLGVLLNENGLDLVAQVRAEGATADAQIESLKKGLGEAAALNPLFVNVHCGKDFWPFRENRRVVVSVQRFAGECGIKALGKIRDRHYLFVLCFFGLPPGETLNILPAFLPSFAINSSLLSSPTSGCPFSEK